MNLKRAYLVLVISVILVILISGCTQQINEGEQEGTAAKQSQEEISLLNVTQLGTLCSGEEECISFCLDNRERCEDYCHGNTENELCLVIFSPVESGNQPQQQYDPAEAPEEDKSVILPAEQPIPKEPLPEQPLTPKEKIWKERIDKVMAPTFCPPIKKQVYPENYYQGPLIDTHFHIPAYPEWGSDEEEGPGEAMLGENVKMSEIACTLQHEGTKKNFAFFLMDEGEIAVHILEMWNKTMEKYPELFTPFIMPPGNDDEPDGFPTVDAKTLQGMLSVYPQLFQGYGEIGLYERDDGAKALPPDNKRLLEIYPIINKEKMLVYFHPGENQVKSLAKVLKEYPNITFIVHGDQIQSDILDLMDVYPNIYYTMNDLYGDRWLLRPEVTKTTFMSHFYDYELLIRKDLARYEDMINRHPDRFMWGTDRGEVTLWTYDRDVGLKLVDYGRAFIGRLDPNVQEKFAYKNAERLIEMRDD